MIGYAVLGADDLDASLAFWDAMVGDLGGKRVMTVPDARGFTLYGVGRDKPMLAITRPYDGRPASAGNGSMIAIPLPSRAAVDAFHTKALAQGAADDGAPGVRGGLDGQEFYGAYFRDPGGNKICGYRVGGE